MQLEILLKRPCWSRAFALSKNVVITIPNASVLNAQIINYSAADQDYGTPPLILHTTITLGYDVPWRKVHETLISAARSTPNILAEPSPFVLQTSLDDFYVSYELNAYTDKPLIMAKVYSELHQNIQDKCNEGGIEILSPHYRAVRDGNQNTIPEAIFLQITSARISTRTAASQSRCGVGQVSSRYSPLCYISDLECSHFEP